MRRLVGAMVVVGAMSFGVSGSAQDTPEEVQTRFYDFTDMLIDGEFQRPDGMFATERGRAQFNSLLNLRRSFIEEIEEAAHETVLE